MREAISSRLESIAGRYHLNEALPDKHIEEICQLHICKWILDFASGTGNVVELGYGDGITADLLAKEMGTYTILEGSKSLADIAKSKLPYARVLNELFEDHQPKLLYDKVLALHVLEHVEDPLHLCRTIRRWIKDTGELVVVVPNADSVHRQLATVMGLQESNSSLSARDEQVGHLRVYDLAELRGTLEKAGFVVFEERGFFLKAVPNSMMLSYSPELLSALNDISEVFPVNLCANIALRARKSP